MNLKNFRELGIEYLLDEKTLKEYSEDKSIFKIKTKNCGFLYPELEFIGILS